MQCDLYTLHSCHTHQPLAMIEYLADSNNIQNSFRPKFVLRSYFLVSHPQDHMTQNAANLHS